MTTKKKVRRPSVTKLVTTLGIWVEVRKLSSRAGYVLAEEVFNEILELRSTWPTVVYLGTEDSKTVLSLVRERPHTNFRSAERPIAESTEGPIIYRPLAEMGPALLVQTLSFLPPGTFFVEWARRP